MYDKQFFNLKIENQLIEMTSTSYVPIYEFSVESEINYLNNLQINNYLPRNRNYRKCLQFQN